MKLSKARWFQGEEHTVRKFALLIGVGGLLVVPSGFAASGTIVQGYAGKGGEVQQVLGANDAPKQTTVVATGSSLPFTGADLALVSAAGMTLLGMGFGLRKIAQRDEL